MVSERAEANMSGTAATGVRTRAPVPPELAQEQMVVSVEVDAAMTVALISKINEIKEGADEQAGAAAAAIVAMSDDMDKIEHRWVNYSPLYLEYSALFAG